MVHLEHYSPCFYLIELNMQVWIDKSMGPASSNLLKHPCSCLPFDEKKTEGVGLDLIEDGVEARMAAKCQPSKRGFPFIFRYIS